MATRQNKKTAQEQEQNTQDFRNERKHIE